MDPLRTIVLKKQIFFFLKPISQMPKKQMKHQDERCREHFTPDQAEGQSSALAAKSQTPGSWHRLPYTLSLKPSALSQSQLTSYLGFVRIFL